MVQQQRYTVSELMVCIFSRELKDYDLGGSPGVRTEVPLASVGLAARMHAPHLICYSAPGHIQTSQLVLTGTTTDYEKMMGNERVLELGDVFDLNHRGFLDWWWAGAMQIDQYGNINLNYIGDWKRPRLIGPGAAGTNTENFLKRFFVWVNEHSPRVFVKKVDFVTSAGREPARRAQMGPTVGKGADLVVSPLAVMDFEPESGRMRLKSVHPGVTVQQVVENTGFELVMPKNVPQTQSPTEEELRILRTEVDPLGILRVAEQYG